MPRAKVMYDNAMIHTGNDFAMKVVGKNSIVDLIDCLLIQNDAFDIDEKINMLKSLSDDITLEKNKYQKIDPEYLPLNVLKCSVIDRLLEVFEEDKDSLMKITDMDGDNAGKMIDVFNRRVKAIKGKLKSYSIEDSVYNAGGIPMGYERQVAGNSVVISIKRSEAGEKSEAEKISDFLVSMSNGGSKSRSEFSEKFFGKKNKPREVAGKKFIDKIFNDPERLRFYTGYLMHARDGFDFPIQGKHEALIDLPTLRKLFVELYKDKKDVQKTHLEYVDGLIQHVSGIEKNPVHEDVSVIPEHVESPVEPAPRKISNESVRAVVNEIAAEKQKLLIEKKLLLKDTGAIENKPVVKNKKISAKEKEVLKAEEKMEKYIAVIKQAKALFDPIYKTIYNKARYKLTVEEAADFAAAKVLYGKAQLLQPNLSHPEDIIKIIERWLPDPKKE